MGQFLCRATTPSQWFPTCTTFHECYVRAIPRFLELSSVLRTPIKCLRDGATRSPQSRSRAFPPHGRFFHDRVFCEGDNYPPPIRTKRPLTFLLVCPERQPVGPRTTILYFQSEILRFRDQIPRSTFPTTSCATTWSARAAPTS